MLEKRRPLRTIRGIAAIGSVLAVSGCGGGRESVDYPLAVTRAPNAQLEESVAPSRTCERELATFHDGSEPARRTIVVPPAPGLRAVAVTRRVTRLEWSFEDLPADCRPVTLAVSVVARGRRGATPTTQRVKVHGRAGTVDVEYPKFLPPPNVAVASAYSLDGRRSRTVSVAIRRGQNTPPDRPEPAPPVTAPAGEPVACRGKTTRAVDPPHDVLTYAPGSPPKPARDARPLLSAIDLRRAAVQIDGRTICATFTFAAPLGSTEFALTLALREPTARCCASLHFRRTARGLEVGHRTIDPNGAYRLEPVPGAGASLRKNTLRLSGSLPTGVPAGDDVGWSITSTYADGEYGPYYGDWLPRYASVGEPYVRHRDGVTVRP